MKPNHVRILIVDGDAASGGGTSRVLEEAGYATAVASSEAAAVQSLAAFRPQLVLLDRDGPGLNGLEVCRRLKGAPGFGEGLVILMSGKYTQSDEQAEGLEAGADGYLVGPMGKRELVARMEAYVRIVRLNEAVREQSQLLALFIKHSPIYAYIKEVTASESRVLQASDNFKDMVGLTGQEMVGKTMGELFGTEFAAKISGEDWAAVTQGEVLRVEEELRGRHYATIKFPIVQGGKTLLGGYTIDVTELRRAEGETRRLAHVFHHAAWGMVIAEAETHRIVGVNEAFARMHGYEVGEMTGMHLREIFAPESLVELAEHARKVVATGRHSYESVHRRRDGSVFPTRAHVSAYKDEAGRVVFRASSVEDITERKRVEGQLQEQAALLDGANDAIYVRGLDGRVTYWNEGAERLLGWTRREALGRKVTELGEMSLEVFAGAEAAVLQEGQWCGELRGTRKRGQEVVLFCRWTLLRDGAGQPKGVLAIQTDITEQKQLEERFLRAQRLESIGALASGIAHDLNNILAPILITAPMLREMVGDAEGVEMAETVAACAERAAGVIQQLLLFARGQPGVRAVVPMRTLAQEIHKLMREAFPRNIEMSVEAPMGLWMVEGDPTQIHQALMNLCVNARDAMATGGRLRLGLENVTVDEAFVAGMVEEVKAGRYVRAWVADTGTGITPENQRRIFEPFFTTKELGKGTGLGLSSVLGIARGHGGFVRVESQVGRGTRFELYLPACGEAGGDAKGEAEEPAGRGQGELILVVDDEAGVRLALRHTLEKYGYRVVLAEDGAAALALFGRVGGEVRAVVTDMMMPNLDGLMLARVLRRSRPELPIVGMTGLVEQVDRKELEEVGVATLLQKPFPAVKFLAAVREALAGKGES